MRYCSLIVCVLSVCLGPTCFAQEEAESAKPDDGWGHLKGQLVVRGEVEPPAELTVDKDQAYCLADGTPLKDPSLVVSDEGELKDAFIFMYFGRRDERPEVHESYAETAEDVVTLDNIKCEFKPYALFLRTSQTLRMKNSDTIGHNCHVALFGNAVNENIPSQDHVDVQLENEERVPGPVKCDIHPWMSAVLLVRDEPYVAITDDEGHFEIRNLPAGTWKFMFWHKRSGYLKELTQESGEVLEGGRRGEVEIEIKSGEILDLGTLTLDADVLKQK